MNTQKRKFTQASLALLVGDIIIFLIFAWIGKVSHAHEVTLSGLMTTAAPFVLGWLTVGIWRGSFTERAWERPGQAALHALVTWLIAGPVGLIIRALALGSGIIWSFALITMVTNAVLLVVWRTAFAWGMQRKGR